MPETLTLTSPIVHDGRVRQVEAMFDMPAAEKATTTVTVDLPIDERPWQVGLIVGPSGAGKTTTARHVFGADTIRADYPWDPRRALVSDFPAEMTATEITGLLTSVGLSSVPAWVRPFGTLSNGEQFRAGIARTLAEATVAGRDVVVVDEFTSVVDRQVGQVASHAIQKGVRRSKVRLVAVTCHFDVVEWLQPDWVFRPAEGSFTWGSVQPRPRVDLDVARVDKAAWRLFAHHHYLSPRLHTAAICWGGWVGGHLVAFTSVTHLPHPKVRNVLMGHRHVVLPDWQGLGIVGRLNDWLGLYLYERGWRFHNTVSHPAMIAGYPRSPRWAEKPHDPKPQGGPNSTRDRQRKFRPRDMGTRSFFYVPPAGTPRPTVRCPRTDL